MFHGNSSRCCGVIKKQVKLPKRIRMKLRQQKLIAKAFGKSLEYSFSKIPFKNKGKTNRETWMTMGAYRGFCMSLITVGTEVWIKNEKAIQRIASILSPKVDSVL